MENTNVQNNSVFNGKSLKELKSMVKAWTLTAEAMTGDVKNSIMDNVAKCNTRIAELENSKSEKSERAKKIEENRKSYDSTHLYFKTDYQIKASRKKTLSGFVFDFSEVKSGATVNYKAVAITNYTLDGFILICADKKGGCFVWLCTKCKINNGATYAVKKELIDTTTKVIKERIFKAVEKKDFSEVLTIAKTSKNFRTECKNTWIVDRVKDTCKKASTYEPPKEN